MSVASPSAVQAACARALAGRLDLEVSAGPCRSLSDLRSAHDRAACHRVFRSPDITALSLPDQHRRLLVRLDVLRALRIGAREYRGIGVAADRSCLRDSRNIDGLFWRVLAGDAAAAVALGLSPQEQYELVASVDQPSVFLGCVVPRLASWLSLADPDVPDDAGQIVSSAATFSDTAADVRQADESSGEFATGAVHSSLRSLDASYRIFDRSTDRLVDAESMVTPDLIAAAERRMDALSPAHVRTVAQIARRLQRRLQARQRPLWRFDLEEGQLDPARLTRIVTTPDRPAPFRLEIPGRMSPAVVTLLIDLSGSMAGAPAAHAALCVQLMATVLERCRVPFEVLGFTTTGWNAVEPWQRAGAPAAPGRLNGVQHVVFKAFSSSWRRSRRGLACLFDATVMRENIDGEALLWAAGRLLRRPERRRVLVVLGDGCPHDEATIAANGTSYLESHLFEVAERLERLEGFDLFAVGLGQSVNRFYRRSATVRNVADIGPVIFDHLSGALMRDTQNERA